MMGMGLMPDPAFSDEAREDPYFSCWGSRNGVELKCQVFASDSAATHRPDDLPADGPPTDSAARSFASPQSELDPPFGPDPGSV